MTEMHASLEEFFLSEKIKKIERDIGFTLGEASCKNGGHIYKGVRYILPMADEYINNLYDFAQSYLINRYNDLHGVSPSLTVDDCERIMDFVDMLQNREDGSAKEWNELVEGAWAGFRRWTFRWPHAKRLGHERGEWVVGDSRGWGILICPFTGRPLLAEVKPRGDRLARMNNDAFGRAFRPGSARDPSRRDQQR